VLKKSKLNKIKSQSEEVTLSFMKAKKRMSESPEKKRSRMHLITDFDSLGDTIALNSDIRPKEFEAVD